MRKSSLSVSVGLGLLLLVSALFSAACPARSGEEDRPVIIISSGSVTLDVSPGEWTQDGDGGKKYRQKDTGTKKWKGLKSFTATTGTCTVSGGKLTVTYGTTTLNLERKKSGLFSKYDAVVEFADGATVSASGGVLTVTTEDSLMKVTNGGTGSGNECNVVDKKITVQQKH